MMMTMMMLIALVDGRWAIVVKKVDIFIPVVS